MRKCLSGTQKCLQKVSGQSCLLKVSLKRQIIVSQKCWDTILSVVDHFCLTSRRQFFLEDNFDSVQKDKKYWDFFSTTLSKSFFFRLRRTLERNMCVSCSSWADAPEKTILSFRRFEKMVSAAEGGVGVCSLASMSCRRELRIAKQAFPTWKHGIASNNLFSVQMRRPANPRTS